MAQHARAATQGQHELRMPAQRRPTAPPSPRRSVDNNQQRAAAKSGPHKQVMFSEVRAPPTQAGLDDGYFVSLNASYI